MITHKGAFNTLADLETWERYVRQERNKEWNGQIEIIRQTKDQTKLKDFENEK